MEKLISPTICSDQQTSAVVARVMPARAFALRQSGLNAVSFLISSSAGIAASVLIARRLGPKGMGLYSLAFWIASLLANISNFGLPDTLRKFISEYTGNGDREGAVVFARRLLWLQVWVASGVTACAALGFFFVHDRAGRLSFALVLLFILPVAIRESISGCMTGFQRYGDLARCNFWAALLHLGLVTAAFFAKVGWVTMLAVVLATTLLSVAILVRAIRREAAWRSSDTQLCIKPSVVSRSRAFAAYSAAASILYVVVWHRPEMYFLGQYSLPTDIAFFSIAFAAATKVHDLAQTFTGVLLPIASERISRFGAQQVSSILSPAIRWVQLVIVPMCFCGMAAAAPVVQLLYGSSYKPVVIPLQLLLLGVAVAATSGIGVNLLTGADMLPAQIRLLLPVAGLNLVAAYFLVPRTGSIGAAGIKMLVYLLTTAVLVRFTIRRFAGVFPWKATARIAGSALLAWAPGWYAGAVSARPAVLAVTLIAGVPINLALLVASGELVADDWQTLAAVLRRQPSQYSSAARA